MKDLHTLDKYRMADHERKYYGCVGDGGDGCFKVYVEGRSFFAETFYAFAALGSFKNYYA